MIHTFYSYKGGVGRSMALANIAELMVRAGMKVIMVDWDLEAPGLEQYYPERAEEVLSKPGLIDMLIDYKERSLRYDPASGEPFFSIHQVEGYLIDLSSPDNGPGKLWLLPAGLRASKDLLEYSSKVRSFDWQDFYKNWEGEIYFEWLRKQFDVLADAVLIDSRTGVTEMGGVCAYQMADVVVMLCAANEQNMDGTFQVLKSLSDPRLPDLRHGRKIDTIVVPARIERLAETKTLNEFRQIFSDRFLPYMPLTVQDDPEILVRIEIPYVPLYAFEEIVAVKQSQTLERAVEMERAYHELATLLIPEKWRHQQPREDDESARERLAKLQKNYDLLTRRVASLDQDIARTISSYEKLALEERRAAFEQEREELVQNMVTIEAQQAGKSDRQPNSAPIHPERRHLELRQVELQKRYDTMSRRIAAIDTDIGRELDSLRRQILDERRSELAAERDQVASELMLIEHRLSSLKVFLSYVTEDKPQVREVYRRLRKHGIDAWLDEENLLPGSDWAQAIRQAIWSSDVILVFLSNRAVTKTGFMQREIEFALNRFDELPKGAILIIPIKLEPCNVPDRLSHVQWVNLSEEQGWEQLLRALESQKERLQQKVYKIDHRTLRPVTEASHA